MRNAQRDALDEALYRWCDLGDLLAAPREVLLGRRLVGVGVEVGEIRVVVADGSGGERCRLGDVDEASACLAPFDEETGCDRYELPLACFLIARAGQGFILPDAQVESVDTCALVI